MKKIIIFLFSVILTMNYATLSAQNDLCEITIFMWNTAGSGWYDNSGIEITVDGISYGTVKLPHDFEVYEGEETVLIPSGEVLFSWKGQFSSTLYGFKIYNSYGDLIYTSPVSLPEGLFFTYQNECPHIANDLCNFKFVLSDDAGIGWSPSTGIAITVDGVDYGFVNLPWGTAYAEIIVPLPSGEVQMVFHGGFLSRFHIEIYNAYDDLIYTSPDDIIENPFFTYQNECPNDIECLPITDFKGVYIQKENQVNLSWTAPESMALTGFDIFRNDSLITHVAPDTISYSDNTTELESGNYKYCVVPTYPFECTLDDKCFETPIIVGIKDYEVHITIYPNPATNLIHISDMVSEVKMYNNIGQLILTQHNTNSINVSELQNGIYLFSVELSTKQIIQKKIIINH